MDIYKDTPAGSVRRAIAEGSFVVKGDAGRTADAMISAADSAKPALRLALGSTAYDSISRALAKRLATRCRVLSRSGSQSNDDEMKILQAGPKPVFRALREDELVLYRFCTETLLLTLLTTF